MTLCDFCGQKCDKSLGCYRELKTEFWGGATGKKITYSPKEVRFFCSDEHRTLFLYGFETGPIQTGLEPDNDFE